MRSLRWASLLLVASLGCTPFTGGLGNEDDGTSASTGNGSAGSGETSTAATTAVTSTGGTMMSSDDTTSSVESSSGSTSSVDGSTSASTTASSEESSTGGPPPQSLPELDCAEEGTLASMEASTQADVTFHNESGQPRQIHWLDYAGTRMQYATIEPSGSWGIGTFVTHPWLIADEQGQCLTIFVTVAGTHDIVLY